MKHITKEIKIGIASVCALFILIYGINYLKGVNMFKPSSYFYVQFENVNGLTKSSPVFADGVRVGIVRSINYDYNNISNVIVEIEMDTELRLPKGSSAELIPELMGGVRMNILLANNPREKHTIGDTIPGTLNNGVMGNVIALMPKLEVMLPKIDSILTSLNDILADKSIPSTLKNVERTTANLEVASGQLKMLLAKDIPQITKKMNTIGDNFILISDNLKDIDYTGIFLQIRQTIDNVKSITEKMNSKDNTMGLLLNDSQLYNNLTTTTTNAANLLHDLQDNPKRYVHFSVFGKKNKPKE